MHGTMRSHGCILLGRAKRREAGPEVFERRAKCCLSRQRPPRQEHGPSTENVLSKDQLGAAQRTPSPCLAAASSSSSLLLSRVSDTKVYEPYIRAFTACRGEALQRLVATFSSSG